MLIRMLFIKRSFKTGGCRLMFTGELTVGKNSLNVFLFFPPDNKINVGKKIIIKKLFDPQQILYVYPFTNK